MFHILDWNWLMLTFLSDFSVLKDLGFVEEKLFAREYKTHVLKFSSIEEFRVWEDNREVSFNFGSNSSGEYSKVLAKLACAGMDEYFFQSVSFLNYTCYRFVIDLQTKELHRYDFNKHCMTYASTDELAKEIEDRFRVYVISTDTPIIQFLKDFYKMGHINPFSEDA